MPRAELIRYLLPFAILLLAGTALADTDASEADTDSTSTEEPRPIGSFWPEYAGVRLSKSSVGELNYGIWTFIRYRNSTGLDAQYTDSFGRTKDVIRRNDLHIAKIMMLFHGWLYDERLRYMLYNWNSIANFGRGSQFSLAGKLGWYFGPALTFGAGVEGNFSNRSMENVHPRMNKVDERNIAESYFRGGFSQGFLAEGELLPRTYYKAGLMNNFNVINVNADQLDTRLDTFSFAFIIFPTTGHYGGSPQSNPFGGGYSDFEHSEEVTTRIGLHYTNGTETKEAQPQDEDGGPRNAQVRLSDGNLFFGRGTFGPGRVIDEARIQIYAADVGVKYRGVEIALEWYGRRIDKIEANFTPDFGHLWDWGFSAQPSVMVIKKKLGVFVSASRIYGDYGEPWDTGVGVNWYPTQKEGFERQFRINAEVVYTRNSPVGGASGAYSVGGNGYQFISSAEFWF